ncbi:hypothetical protein GDO81_011901 [Engystomops pustulosus]|uniref:Uncharacterized protein n=1 Tax=Engystomops pustulosus TaxID=76066 RepID=A0AAV7BHW8_ENGPU|nr:hypothetical protein GDO81_011901 [Engystomops pustulosus]
MRKMKTTIILLPQHPVRRLLRLPHQTQMRKMKITIILPSPASCEEASEATPSNPGHIVILDEKNEDNDYPASPASCEGASEATPSNPDKPSRKRRRIKMSKDDHTAPKSPVSVVSSCSSSNFAPVADGDHGKSKKLKGEKHHSKRSTKSNREAIPAFQIEPVNSNQDVFKFLVRTSLFITSV